MTRHVALLRAVNLGSYGKVRMAALRELLAGLGYTDVTTYLQSGNAVFTAADGDPGRVAARIEERLAAELGLDTTVIVRTAAELRGVVDRNPMEVRDPAKYAVAFLAGPPDPERLRALDPASYAPEELRAGERELYLWFPNGLGRAKLTPVIARGLGVPATVRNWNTVTRLLELAET